MNGRMHRFSVHIYGSISIGSFQFVKRIIVLILSFERIIHQTFIGKNLSHLRILMIKSDSRINPIWVIHRNPYISFHLYGSIRTFQPLVPGFYCAVYALKHHITIVVDLPADMITYWAAIAASSPLPSSPPLIYFWCTHAYHNTTFCRCWKP